MTTAVLPELTPNSTYGKAVAVVWVCLCVAVLIFGYVQRAVHDMPVAFTWFMIALTFPLGLVGVLVGGVGQSTLAEWLGYTYAPFRDELPIWVFASVLGYLQWFVLVPLFIRKFLRRSRGTVKRSEA